METQDDRAQRVAVDIGGTFTDLAWYDKATNAVTFEKVLSTPPRFADGVHQILAKGGVDMEQVLHFVHGSTITLSEDSVG